MNNVTQREIATTLRDDDRPTGARHRSVWECEAGKMYENDKKLVQTRNTFYGTCICPVVFPFHPVYHNTEQQVATYGIILLTIELKL